MVTVEVFIKQSTERLTQAGIDTARLDVLVLLQDILNQDKAHILAHPERVLSATESDLLNTYIAQRTKHIPLAYIRGQVEFYGRTFTVSPNVLVPRPESESMIDLLLQIPCIHQSDIHILDVGTGSGCLGITAALELPQATVELSDIDTLALQTAQKNASNLAAKVTMIQADLLIRPFSHNCGIILANLPYVPTNYPINQAATHEPALALFAGKDGMDAYRLLWQQIAGLPTKRTKRPAHVITESLGTQHVVNTNLAQAAGYRLTAAQGLARHFILLSL